MWDRHLCSTFLARADTDSFRTIKSIISSGSSCWLLGTYPDVTSYQHVPGLVFAFVLSVELDGFQKRLHFTRLFLQEVWHRGEEKSNVKNKMQFMNNLPTHWAVVCVLHIKHHQHAWLSSTSTRLKIRTGVGSLLPWQLLKLVRMMLFNQSLLWASNADAHKDGKVSSLSENRGFGQIWFTQSVTVRFLSCYSWQDSTPAGPRLHVAVSLLPTSSLKLKWSSG